MPSVVFVTSSCLSQNLILKEIFRSLMLKIIPFPDNIHSAIARKVNWSARTDWTIMPDELYTNHRMFWLTCHYGDGTFLVKQHSDERFFGMFYIFVYILVAIHTKQRQVLTTDSCPSLPWLTGDHFFCKRLVAIFVILRYTMFFFCFQIFITQSLRAESLY